MLLQKIVNEVSRADKEKYIEKYGEIFINEYNKRKIVKNFQFKRNNTELKVVKLGNRLALKQENIATFYNPSNIPFNTLMNVNVNLKEVDKLTVMNWIYKELVQLGIKE